MKVNRTPIITKDVKCDYSKGTPIGYIYITINLVNHKKYIGKHTIQDGIKDECYLGSGHILLKALNKYGSLSFDNWVLDWAFSVEELNNLEVKWISEFDAVNSEYYYNIMSGGEGFSSQDVKKCWEQGKYNDISGENNPSKRQDIRKKLSQTTTEYGKLHHKECSERVKKAWKNNRDKFLQCRTGEESPFYNRGTRVICIETEQVFPNAVRAAEWIDKMGYGKPHNGCKILSCCKHIKGFHTAYGFHWEYYIESEVKTNEN